MRLTGSIFCDIMYQKIRDSGRNKASGYPKKLSYQRNTATTRLLKGAAYGQLDP